MKPFRIDADTVINLDLVLAIERTDNGIEVTFTVPYLYPDKTERRRMLYTGHAGAALWEWMQRNAPYQAGPGAPPLVDE